MKNGLPVVLIWGSDFVAKKLASDFVGESVMVVLKGKAEDWLNIGKGEVAFCEDVSKIDYRIDYAFDFGEDEVVWSRIEADEGRLVVIKRNKNGEDTLKKLNLRKADWRLVCGFDIYGEGMELGENWVAKVIETAVLNKELELPKNTGYLRCIEVADFVEAVKKACFVPGVSGERLMIFGRKVSIEMVCKTMVTEAKMTKKGIVVNEDSSFEVEDSMVSEYWDRISWDGGKDFDNGSTETVRYFFERMDPLVRSKTKAKQKEETGERKRFMEVEIEEEQDLGSKIEEVRIATKLQEQEQQKDLRLKKEEDRIATEKQELDVRNKIEEDRMATELQEKVQKKQEEERSKNEALRMAVDEEKDDTVDLSEFVIKPAVNIKDVRFKKEEVRIAPELQEQEQKKQDIRSKIEYLRIATETAKKKKFNFNWGLNWKLVVAPFIFLLVVYMGLVVSFFGGIYASTRAIDKSKVYLEEKKIDELEKLTEKNLVKIERLKERLRIISFEGKAFSYKGWGEVLRVLETVWKMEREMATFLVDWSGIGEGLFGDKDIDWQEEIEVIKSKLVFLENNLGMIEARTEGDWSFLPGRFRSFVSEQAKEAYEWKQVVSQISDSMEVFYYLIGADGGRKDFLILMQNEMELRPNGGFIGSFGVLSFEDGRFLNLEVGDVYDIDGQLKGHVEPPKPIKEILGEASWYLRDANWQADYLQSAKDIEWFYKKETGRNIDGIISLNLAAAKELVEAVGEVWVADYNEKVTAENLYEQAQFHSEKGFFAGSRQKSMFLGKLAGQLVEEVKEAQDFKQLAIVKAILKSLDNNEIQIYAKDPQIKVDLANMGWDGSMYVGGCAVENCLADYLYIVEANLGVNKSNYFLKRSVERLVDISSRSITRVIKIAYENTARSTTWPGGDYKNYMRVYIPVETNIAEVSIYDTADPTNKKILTSDELEVTARSDKRELAFLVTVPVTKKRTVEIRYSSSIDLNLYSEFSYLSYIQKQSGFGETPIVSLVSYPAEWQPIQVEPAATTVNGKLLFDQTLEKDLVSGVVMGK